jgi:parvulin-like peptidyl-prolyl isomerase
MKARALLAIAGLVMGAAGCQLRSTPPELVPSQFVRSRSAVGPNPVAQPVDQNGALNYGELHAPLLPDQYNNPNPSTPTTVSPLVRRAIPAPGEGEGVAVATTAPATAPVAQSRPSQAGQYQIVGTVIANVNGTPIFADKVLSSLNSELAADARKFPPEQFRVVARNEILQKVQELQAHLLEIAAANKFVAPEDKTQAELMAQMYRRQLITEAGGSLEMAKERARESGRTFDELIQDRYDLELVRVYYQKRIVPKIQITADDMRRYYHQHINDFTQHAQAHFRLIKIDVEKSGGIELATEKADKVVRELKAGADFSDLSQRYNDDPVLKKNGGDEGWVNKGDFAREKVEQAVWSLQPGEFTDHPIDESTVLYLAKLEARKPGLVKPFDTEEVQRKIHEILFEQQFSVLREQVLDELRRNAVYFENKDALATSVEMAMQRYALWTAAR